MEGSIGDEKMLEEAGSKLSNLRNMKKLIKSKMYLVGTFTMACILFVSTGIQFWMTDYFVTV